MNLVQARTFISKYHKILLLSSLLFVTLLDMFVITHRPFHFSSGWSLIIRNVESGQGYKACDADYIPNCNLTDQRTAMREPIPVYFFALIGKLTNNSPFAFQFSQLIFNVLICLFMYLLALELGDRTLAVVAAFAWAFYIQAVHTVMTVNGDLIAAFFVLAAVLYFIRATKNGTTKDWLLFGGLFGLAALSRSSTLLIFLILVAGSILYFWRSGQLYRAWYQPVLATILFGLVMAPWVIRNEIVFGKPILGTTLVGYNLYRHNAIVSSDVYPHYVGPTEGVREIKALVARTPELRLPINEARVDEIFQKEALRIILSHPKEYIELSVFRFLPLWFNFGVRDQYGDTAGIVDDLIDIQQAVLFVIFLIAIAKVNWQLRLLAASLFFFIFGYLAIDSQLRYMIPAMPLVILISMVGIAPSIALFFNNKWPRLFADRGVDGTGQGIAG